MTLEYSANPGGRRYLRLLAWYGIGLGFCVVPMMLVWGGLVFIVPRFREMFKDFRTSLPSLTEAVLTLADVASQPLGLLLLLVLIGLLPVLPAVYASAPEERKQQIKRGVRVFVAWLLVLAVFVGTVAVSIALPWFKLMSAVRGGGDEGMSGG